MRIASLLFPTTAICPSSHPQQQSSYGKATKTLRSAVNTPKVFSHLKLKCSKSNNGDSSSQGRGTSSATSSHPNNQQQYQEQYQPWESGNVEADFQKLRSAVHKSRADTSLTFWESQFEDDYFAYKRRPLQPDFIRYIAVPLASSAVLSLPMLTSSTIIPTRHFKVALRIGTFLMDAYYYMFCLAFPLLLWPLLHREDTRRKEIERRNEQVSPWNDLRLKPMYEDRCNNHCLCLIDLLVSCILPTTILLTIVFFPRDLVHNKLNILDRSVSKSSFQATHLQNLMLAILKLVTRLGSTVSLYQYGKHIFELNRANQPRPLPKYTVILQQYVNSMTKMLPTGLLFDLTSVLCRFRDQQRKEHWTWNLIQQLPTFFRYGFLASIVPPLIHVTAFLRLIRVFYGKNESFINPFLKSDPRTRIYSTETDYFTTERLTFNNVNQHSVTWRWCLKWRRRRRVIDTIERWWILFIADFDLNKFFELDYYDTSERELQKILSNEDRYMSKNKDIADLSQEQDFIPLEARVAGMQARIAARHRQEYKKAEGKKHDPLGIAVEKYLGLGLNFNYDHMRKLRVDETPSLNRLFARAAKSAVKRIHQLEHQNNVTLESIEDIEEKAMVAAKMGKQLHEEREYLARTLLLLQPRSDDKGSGDDIFRDEQEESSKVLQFFPRSLVEKFGQPVVTLTGRTPDPFEVALEKTSGEEAVEKYRSDEQILAQKRKDLMLKHSASGEGGVMEEESMDDNQIVFC